jgi:photosystem II stability/assembly factor-like uncharacterized protein
MKLIFLILGSLLLMNYSFSQGKEVYTKRSLEGEIIRSFDIEPISGNLIVGLKGEKAGSAKVYLSSDAGENWNALNQGKALCDSCEDVQTVCWVNENTILAGTWKNGIFLSKNSGKSFDKVKSVKATDIRSIRKSRTGKIFAATTTEGILVSDNNGKKWNRLHDEALIDDLASWNIRIHPSSNQIIYAMSFKKGIYRSVDGGVSWKQELKPEEDLMFWDIAFYKNEMHVIASNENNSFIYSKLVGDKKWNKNKLNILGQANSLNIIRTFRDYYFLIGTWDAGLQKSFAIEQSVDGFRCIEFEEKDTIGVAHIYSNNDKIYNFSWGDGVKIIEREKECEVLVQSIISKSNKEQENWIVGSSCKLNYFYFKLYNKWGELFYEKSADIETVNADLGQKIKELKTEQHIYWVKFSFEDNKDTLDIKGHVQIKD